MKKVFVILMSAVFVITSQSVSAQLRDVPAEVTTAFAEKYPNAKNVSWSDKISSFQATFKDNGAICEARFNKDGIWKETEKAITLEQLPSSVQEAFNSSKFKEWTLRTVAKIDKNNGGSEYRIYVKDDTIKRKYLYYSEDGKLIREAYKI
jgi:hypothetical protein